MAFWTSGATTLEPKDRPTPMGWLRLEFPEKPLTHRDGTFCISGSQPARRLGVRVRCDPGHQQHSPQHDEDRQHRLVCFRYRGNLAIPFKPGILQLGYDRIMLHEAHGRGEIVEEPGKAAVVEINDAEPCSIDQQICEAQIGMNQAEPVAWLTVSADAS